MAESEDAVRAGKGVLFHNGGMEKTMKRPKILVVGSMNMDLVMHGLDRPPATGESVFCSGYQYAVGGKGSNQACAAAKIGAEVYLVGRVGTDENAQRLLERIEEAGVHTKYVVKDPQQLTGLSTMNIYQDGTYFSVFAAGANMKLAPEDVRYALELEPDIDMLVMQLEMPLETVYASFEMAKEKGIPVFLDAGPAQHIPLERLRGIDILSPNEAETAALTGIVPDTDEEVLKAAEWLFREAAPKYVLLKLGSRGAAIYDGDKLQMVEGFKVNAVDSTAAGDTFGAAAAIRLCQGASMESAVRYGHAAAGICVTRKGGYDSIPNEKEVEDFILQGVI